MTETPVESPRRRRVLAGIGAGVLACGAGIGTTAASSHESVEVVLDNVGASAWELVEADESVGETGVEDPTLTLREGVRYTFVNLGAGPHPLAFRDEDGNDLLRQGGSGSYEDQDDVDYEESGDEMTFTLTAQFAQDVDSYICTVHASMEGRVEIGDTDGDEGEDEDETDATVGFPVQATASSTFTGDEPTTPAVTVDVTATEDSAVVVTYEDGGDLVVAGLDVFDADELDGEGVVVPVEDVGGFPGEHVAHAVPTDDLSGEYAPGDTVSAETANAVADSDAATVVQAELAFEDQQHDGPIEEGDVLGTVDVTVLDGGDGGDDGNGGGAGPYRTLSSHDDGVRYLVDVHPTDDEGELVAPEFVGASDVLAGENGGAEIVAERVPGDGAFNELPFEGTDTFVGMIHVVDDDAAAGDPASPGSFPVLPNVGVDGPVPGGVTDLAELTAESDTDDDPDGGDTDDDPDGGDTDDDAGADDDGPGFGPVAGVAGLGGLAAYAYRKLTLGGGSPTAEDGAE